MLLGIVALTLEFAISLVLKFRLPRLFRLLFSI